MAIGQNYMIVTQPHAPSLICSMINLFPNFIRIMYIRFNPALFGFVVFIVCLFTIQHSVAQSSFTMDTLEALNKNKGEINVYFCAMWCLPCVKHLKQVSDSLEKIPGFRGNNYIVFDRYSFSGQKLKRFDLGGFDTSHVFLIPGKYYSKSFIQFNPSEKVLERFLKDLAQNFTVSENGIAFWFDSMMRVTSEGAVEYYGNGN